MTAAPTVEELRERVGKGLAWLSENDPGSRFLRSLHPQSVAAARPFSSLPLPAFESTPTTTSQAETRAVRAEECVFCIEGVPAQTMSLPSTLPRKSIPTSQVLAASHSLQVNRIDTQTDTAKMVDLQAGWNGSAHQLIDEAVSISIDSMPDVEHTIGIFSSPIASACPQPAAIGLFYLQPETVGYRLGSVMDACCHD